MNGHQTTQPSPGPSRKSWRLPAAAIGAMLVLLAALIYAGTTHLRHKIRDQILRRDGEILHAVALMQQISGSSTEDLGGELEHFADQFNVALQISKLNQGVIGARLFAPDGRFQTSFPAYVLETSLPPADLAELQSLRPVSHFQPSTSLDQLFLPELLTEPVPPSVPLLEVNIPLHRKDQPTLLGIAQFIIDGENMAAEFAHLDHNLAVQAGIAFLAGGSLIVLTLSWAFRRLQRSNRLLEERTARLLHANQELALAAKTSAVGAVTAHLLHGLANPLAGLQDFVASRGEEDEPDEEWETLKATTQRMRGLIDDVIHLIGEESSQSYEVGLSDVVETSLQKQAARAQQAGVKLIHQENAQANLDNRQANLILLILNNLVENAIQASPPGQTVEIRLHPHPKGVALEISDHGPGIPPHLLASLFSPCRSTKSDGNGVGLAISKQLANHLGADLELSSTSPQGCVFTLRIPCPSQQPKLASREVSG